VGPRAILDAVVKRKIPSSSRESNRSLVAIPTEQYTRYVHSGARGSYVIGPRTSSVLF
jgi:hypothetical protein